MLQINSVNNGNCLELMSDIDDKSIDMILCDLPYGTTACKWDTVIPFEPLWAHYKRIIKNNGAIVLTASQPFTSALVMSNVKMFKHEWIWIKNRGSNFANTVREPMKEHESVLVFSTRDWVYNKQMQNRTGGGLDLVGRRVTVGSSKRDGIGSIKHAEIEELSEFRVPSSWQKFNTQVGLHPTQKPVALFEYLIKTYTNEGELVLDNCAGSGTTAIACLKTNRNYILIEQEGKYCDIANKRIAEFTP